MSQISASLPSQALTTFYSFSGHLLYCYTAITAISVRNHFSGWLYSHDVLSILLFPQFQLLILNSKLQSEPAAISDLSQFTRGQESEFYKQVINCEFCGRQFYHEGGYRCHLTKVHDWRVWSPTAALSKPSYKRTMTCQYCHKEFSSTRSKSGHEWRCARIFHPEWI
jgi:hypothetical protein